MTLSGERDVQRVGAGAVLAERDGRRRLEPVADGRLLGQHERRVRRRPARATRGDAEPQVEQRLQDLRDREGGLEHRRHLSRQRDVQRVGAGAVLGRGDRRRRLEPVAVGQLLDNTDAGTATASASYAGDANHKSSSDSKTFAIEKAASTTAVTCPVSVTYNGSAQEPCSANVTGAGGLDQSLPVAYSDNTNAGTATASASFGGDANHKSSSDSETFTIDKADSTTAVTCPVSVTYNGSAQEPCSANVTGAGG